MQQPTKLNRQVLKARLSRKGGRKNLARIYHRSKFQRETDKRQASGHEAYPGSSSQDKQAPSAQEKQAGRIVSLIKQNAPSIVVCTSILWCLTMPVLAVQVADLIGPVTDLKDTIFGGWMWVPKIGAAVGGCLMAVYNQNIMPLATGAGVGLGIHFYDLYLKADGALM